MRILVFVLKYLVILTPYMILAALFWTKVEDDPRKITVNRKNVANYSKHINSLKDKDKNSVPFIDDALSDAQQFVRSEVLFREALDFGLDQGDQAIKYRLAKKMYMYFLEIERNKLEVTEKDVLKYFKNHKEDYYIEPTITFAHVFFGVKNRDFDLAEQLANEKVYYLNENATTFAEAVDHGEKFAFQTNYVRKDGKYIAKHFGEDFTQKLFQLDKNLTRWFGPFVSRHGAHAVMVIDRTYGRYPRLEDVATRVKRDTERYKLKMRVDKKIADLQEAYEINVDRNVPKSLTTPRENVARQNVSKKPRS